MAKSNTAKRRLKAREKPERGGVQSVRIAAKILKALASESGALPLKDLASATGLARAKAHRYLTSLRSAGLVSQNLDTGHYQIGPEAVAIGLAGLRRISPVAEVCNALPALRDLINQTVTVAVWSETGPVVVAMQESDHWITMNIRIGSRLPILTTAIGRIFLAHLPGSVVAPLVAAERRNAQIARSGRAVRRRDRWPDERDTVAAVVTRTKRADPRRRCHRGARVRLPQSSVAVIWLVARSELGITGWNGSAVQALATVASQLSVRLGFAGGESHFLPKDRGDDDAAAPVNVAGSRRR